MANCQHVQFGKQRDREHRTRRNAASPLVKQLSNFKSGLTRTVLTRENVAAHLLPPGDIASRSAI